MPSRLILVVKGHLVQVGARFAREHALTEEPRSSRRFRWFHLEPQVLDRPDTATATTVSKAPRSC